ncbi:MAG: hypothetical protein Edafosvirus1_148 [Edafosvirus sp.]|uniref:Uncharacterized protein n=1 Tax=Edafosvirus sp. TaxID=2487765 RepID=A0A3G4ZSE6_9VIRU|nr:MAG: hypothetical protein Edafosvirus1_148 [Edafosvirus sp.]
MNDAQIIKTLLPHERELLKSGEIKNITHKGATSAWLDAPSSPDIPDYTHVYRVMGDIELLYLIKNNKLPDTQAYQSIQEGPRGREYSEKYLNGRKWVSTNPTTVIEFTCPSSLITELFNLQHKIEDGTMSMGLGDKAGGGLGQFNESLIKGDTKWRIVKVKRSFIKK